MGHTRHLTHLKGTVREKRLSLFWVILDMAVWAKEGKVQGSF